jgi:hypothetical protein
MPRQQGTIPETPRKVGCKTVYAVHIHSFMQVDSRDHGNLEFLSCVEFSMDLGVWIDLALEFVVRIARGRCDRVLRIPSPLATITTMIWTISGATSGVSPLCKLC